MLAITRVSRLAAITFLCLIGAVTAPTAACAAATPSPRAEDKEAVRFGQNLASAYGTRDLTQMTSLIDVTALGTRVGRSMSIPEVQLASFAAGFSKRGLHDLVQAQFKMLETAHGTVKFMRMTASGRALVRFNLNDRGFDWMEFVLERDAAGRYHAVDWYQLSRGELVSVTIGGLGQLLVDPNPGLLRTLFGVQKTDPEMIERLKSIGKFQRAGQYAEALAAMDQLPEPLASSRTMLITRAGVASMANQDAAYRKTLAQLARLHAADPSAAFALIDHYLYEKDLDKAMAAISTIEQRVGVDGVTRLLKANVNLAMGNLAQTVTFAKEAVQLEPDFETPYFSLALAHVRLGQFAEAVAAFTSLSSQFGYTFERQKFLEDPTYAVFVKSAAFKKWLPK